MPSEAFAHAVAQAVTAAGRDDMLPVLTGVRIEIDGSQISLHNLPTASACPTASAGAPAPRRVGGSTRAGACSATPPSLTAGSEVTIALAASGSVRASSGSRARPPAAYARPHRLLDGEFPKVRSLFPNEHQTVAKVDKHALIDSVKRVALVAERNTAVHSPSARAYSHPRRQVRDEAPGIESVEAEIDGGEITTGFNPQFLLDGLTAIDEDVVGYRSLSLKPVVISGSVPSEGEDPGFRYLLMPRRLLS